MAAPCDSSRLSQLPEAGRGGLAVDLCAPHRLPTSRWVPTAMGRRIVWGHSRHADPGLDRGPGPTSTLLCGSAICLECLSFSPTASPAPPHSPRNSARKQSPGQSGSVGRTFFSALRGCQCNSPSGHIPGLWVWLGQRIDVSLTSKCLFLPLSASLSNQSIYR